MHKMETDIIITNLKKKPKKLAHWELPRKIPKNRWICAGHPVDDDRKVKFLCNRGWDNELTALHQPVLPLWYNICLIILYANGPRRLEPGFAPVTLLITLYIHWFGVVFSLSRGGLLLPSTIPLHWLVTRF